MTNEIKEILDKLKDCVNNPIDIEVDQFTLEAYHIPNYFCLDATTNDCKLLLDYITNLQEEKENAVECLKYYEEKHFIKPAIDNTKLTIELYNAYLKEINDLQKRIDKATDYLLDKYVRGLLGDNEVNNVVKILRGDE